MKFRNFTTLFLLFVITSMYSQSLELNNAKAKERFEKSEIELNEVYNRLFPHLTKSEKKLLRTSQRHWLKYRDLHSKLISLDKDQNLLQNVYYQALFQINENRIIEFKRKHLIAVLR